MLTDLGHGDLANEMLQDANNSITTIENVEMYINNNNMTVQELLTQEPEQIEEIYYQLLPHNKPKGRFGNHSQYGDTS